MSMTSSKKIITAGSNYLDIDAYACMVGLAELLRLKGENAIAWSPAAHNYSVVPSLVEEGQILRELPSGDWEEKADYIIVDVSDPEYLGLSVPLNRVVGVYDHHVGFESYWQTRIGENARIEFIGAAATLIYREWKSAGLQDRMTASTAQLLAAAILDNTLNLTSSNTTEEDRDAFRTLCEKAGLDETWRASYFAEVQKNVEADLKNALFNDLKTIRNNPVLPDHVAQICVWDGEKILQHLPRIRQWFACFGDQWMLNIIDLKQRCCYFVCDDAHRQNEMERIFDIHFKLGVAKTPVSYLRKEIIKKTLTNR